MLAITSIQWRILIFVSCVLVVCSKERLICYTCSVDFRSTEFFINDTCLNPSLDNEKDRSECSENSVFCKGSSTRIGGTLASFQRQCAGDCVETCTEKGYGIAIAECSFCCTKNPKCGWQTILRDSASSNHQWMTVKVLTWFILLNFKYILI